MGGKSSGFVSTALSYVSFESLRRWKPLITLKSGFSDFVCVQRLCDSEDHQRFKEPPTTHTLRE